MLSERNKHYLYKKNYSRIKQERFKKTHKSKNNILHSRSKPKTAMMMIIINKKYAINTTTKF